MPPIGWALNGIDFASIKTVLGTNAKGEEVAIGWGLFIKEPPPAGPSAEETLLTEIRDELRKRAV